MSLTANDRVDSYTGNNATSSYAYTFRILDDDYITVVVFNTSTGVATVLTKTTDYTVSGVGLSAGGSISLVDDSQAWIYTGGYLSSSYKIYLIGATEKSQTTEIRNQGAYYPILHENAFDKLTMLYQEAAELIRRSIKIQLYDDSSEQFLPSATSRAGKFLSFDASGNVTVSDGNVVPEFGESNAITITDGQSATDLAGETFDGASYTSGIYYMEIIRGTTVMANVISAVQYLNGTWRVVQGSALANESHGVTLSVSQTTTVGQLRAALDSGAGDGTIKIKKHFFNA